MASTLRAPLLATLATLAACADPGGKSPALLGPNDWAQWGRDATHDGASTAVGQDPVRILAEWVVDPHADALKAEAGGSLLAHYPVPLLIGDEAYIAVKGGRYVPCDPPGSGRPAPCGPDSWDTQTWTETKLVWTGARLVEDWSFESDWKPVPNGPGINRWEPVFHAVVAGAFVYVPGWGGTVHKVDRSTGRSRARLTPPFATDAATFVAGPLVADAAGNVYYNALRLDLADPWRRDALGAWLVKIAANDRVTAIDFAALALGAPSASAACAGEFSAAQLPWPPSATARPPSVPCGSQRPGLNVAPAVAPDGTVFTVSRAHLSSRDAFLVAARSDLSPRWAGSLAGRLDNGCGSPLLPGTATPGGCRSGAPRGVDPATNQAPAGRVVDTSTSSPVVAPDGSVLYGSYTRYNYSRGQLMRFGPEGTFLGSYDFGWDSTPAIFRHGGTYSVLVKDNHYPVGSYCGNSTYCPRQATRYDLTQLTPDLVPEWHYTNDTDSDCTRVGDQEVRCTPQIPAGFEWCINAPAVDARGRVYGNAEDGRLHVIGADGEAIGSIFLDSALGAAYTPVALDRVGRIYVQNNGRLFVVGN